VIHTSYIVKLIIADTERKLVKVMGIWIGFLALGIGLVISAVAYLFLVYILPRSDKKTDTRISIIALNASFWLVISGIIIIFLGLLYLMRIIPPPSW